MKLEIECNKCGKVQEADGWAIIKAIMDTAEHGSIYGGFLCEECSKKLNEED